MGKISHFPQQTDKNVDVIQVQKDKVIINGMECHTMELDDFIESLDISDEAAEKFVKGLFELIKDEIKDNWSLMKIFREVFKK